MKVCRLGLRGSNEHVGIMTSLIVAYARGPDASVKECTIYHR
jgi:hypothetical protein